uniref:Uncharacterized protein n=1 Tax=Arundo donax TaxID=35708 RepID=A0A0A9A560_ARUDO
MRGARRNV